MMMMMIIIPVLIGALEQFHNHSEIRVQHTGKLEIKEVQKTTILGTAHKLRKALK